MKVRQAVAKTGLYAPPLEGRTDSDLLLLDFNESTVPPPPRVVAAINGFLEAGRARVYPEYQPFLAKLAAYAGVPEQQLILTNGSDQALDIIVRALVSEGDEVLFPRPGFAMIPQIAGVHGARMVSPQFRPDMGFPVEEVLEAVTPRTRLIALTSPNNPDPKEAVWDEYVGMWATCLLLPKTLPWMAAAFVCFRVLDIWKPWPIRRLERLPGGLGIMADDLLAGIAGAAALNVVRLALPAT